MHYFTIVSKEFDLSFQSTYFLERLLPTASKFYSISFFTHYFLHGYNLLAADIVTEINLTMTASIIGRFYVKFANCYLWLVSWFGIISLIYNRSYQLDW